MTATVRVGAGVVTAGHRETLTAYIRSDQGLGKAIVVLQVYDNRGARVFTADQVRLIPANSLTRVTRDFIPTRANFSGTYWVAVGVFGHAWKPMYVWSNSANSFEVKSVPRPRFSVRGIVAPQPVYRGQVVVLTAVVTVVGPGRTGILADFEIYRGSTKIYQRTISNVLLPRNTRVRLTRRWVVPRKAPAGTYVMSLGLFGPNWSPLYEWNGKAAFITVHVG